MKLYLLLAVALTVTACNKQSTTDIGKGQIYQTLDQREVITIISADELEYKAGDVNLVCKYTKQGDTPRLRVVSMVFGTAQVNYYEITTNDLEASNKILYNRAAFAREQVEIQNRIAVDRAIENNDLPRVRLLTEKANAQFLNDALRSAIAKSIRNNEGFDVDIVRYLLSRGAEPDLGSPAIYRAIGNNDLPRIRLLTEKASGKQLNSALSSAVGKEDIDVDIVQFFLSKGADPNYFYSETSGFIRPPLLVAIRDLGGSRRLDVVKALCDKGADVNFNKKLDGYGFGEHNPLIEAVTQSWDCRDAHLVEFLLQRGADPNLGRYGNRTALEYIEKDDSTYPEGRGPFIEIVPLLKKFGARSK